jgi:uncharacterized protein (TIGR02996 family)
VEAELLDAIYERPEDDAPRWVYTDYLLERGDPRGDFLVLQLLRRRRPLTPDEARAERMLQQHADRWVPAELARKTLRHSWRFERGFLARCQLRPSEQPIGSPQHGHPAWRTVHTLSAPGSGFGANRVLYAPALAELRHLSLDHGAFVEGFLRDREPLHELETLAFGWYASSDRAVIDQLCASPILPNPILLTYSVPLLTALAESALAARIERLSLWGGNIWNQVPAELRARVAAVDFLAWDTRRRRFDL